jgi:HlyD family secretion protein
MLRPGMNAEVEVLVDEAQDILLVPNNAIVLPQDVPAAAMVLGLDPEQLDLAALGGGRRTLGGAGADAPEGAAAAGAAAAAPGGAGAENAPAAAAPGGTPPGVDSLRALTRRGGGGAGGGTGGGGGMRVMRGEGQGGRGAGVFTAPAGPQGAGARNVRRAVVFVVNESGVPEPRAVTIGLFDYDHTEIVSGLEEGAQVALLGAAQLQAQSQEFLNRIRQGPGGFGSGPVMIGPGGGGGGGGGGGRGG